MTANVGAITFGALSEDAKEYARELSRQHLDADDWYRSVFEDADQIAALLGIEIKRSRIKTFGGGWIDEPMIFFSDLYSQGAGAAFVGTWRPHDDPIGALNRLMSYAPIDAALHEIAFNLALISERCHGVLAIDKVEISAIGRHYNSGSARFNVVDFEAMPYWAGWNEFQTAVWEALRTRFRLHPDEFETDISAAIRPFMDWIFARLCDEHEHLTSDETIDEGLSDLHFTDTGMIIQPAH